MLIKMEIENTNLVSSPIIIALNSIYIKSIHIPLIMVKERNERICFIAYFIALDDPIYPKVKDEPPEYMAEACKAVYFYIKKSRPIDRDLLIKALKKKIKGAVRKQRKLDAVRY